MSLSGYFDDLISGQSFGTTDAQAAAGAAADQQIAGINSNALADQLNAGMITQAQADQIAAQEAQDASTTVDTSVAATTDAVGNGLLEGAQDGLNSEANILGQVAAGASNAASGAFSAALKKFFSSISLTTWVVLIAVVFLYFYFGGITRRAKKVFG